MKKAILAAVAVTSFTSAVFFSSRPALAPEPDRPVLPRMVEPAGVSPAGGAPATATAPVDSGLVPAPVAAAPAVEPSPVVVPTPAPALTLTPAPAPDPVPAPAEPSGITLADVALHATEEDCWTTINGNVYDVTAYFGHHPGGDRNILKLCGKDGTAAFERQHGDSRRPNAVLDGFIIGTLSN